MSSSNTPTTAQLLDRHPLLRRLSGQIVWLMFEEHDADPDDIQAFLDRMQPVMNGSAELIEAILSGEELYARIRRDGKGVPCEKCTAMEGKAIALHQEGAEQLLPPYGLGCPLRAEIIPPGQRPPDEDELLDPAKGSAHGDLVCGDWIFTHPWGNE
ncbi:hypothetical protein [Desulfovibrio ferrophilus]|uniref:Uncharacterized protein n=1 Tax=Desulfovibrio ferrophilus TaxID=241368 RepID=A0A2Z6AU61_9BACT|nr:hypothetical protein [Desulfovibrio ferrophilus]BBD06760.1 uncharacterized protein DFE_0034 [Desulfovibrio ferrophilus]